MVGKKWWNFLKMSKRWESEIKFMTKKQALHLIYEWDIRAMFSNKKDREFLKKYRPELLKAYKALLKIGGVDEKTLY